MSKELIKGCCECHPWANVGVKIPSQFLPPNTSVEKKPKSVWGIAHSLPISDVQYMDLCKAIHEEVASSQKELVGEIRGMVLKLQSDARAFYATHRLRETEGELDAYEKFLSLLDEYKNK